MNKSINKIEIYEINNSDVSIGENLELVIENHWNLKARVILKYKDESITVLAKDLIKAIENAQNIHHL